MMNPRTATRVVYCVLSLLLIFLPVASLSAEDSEPAVMMSWPEGAIPPVLYTSLSKQDRSYPTFVSAEAAVDADGRVNGRYFHPTVAEDLQDLLLHSPETDGCLQLGHVYTDIVNAPDRSSLAKAVRESDLVLLGTVVDREFGFHFMEAGQLLTIRVEEVLRGQAKLAQYCIFLPSGHFTAGPYDICKSDSRYPDAPNLGAEVVALVPEVEDPEEPYLDLVWDTSLITIESPAKLSFPKGYGEGPEAVSRKELLQRVRSLEAE